MIFIRYLQLIHFQYIFLFVLFFSTNTFSQELIWDEIFPGNRGFDLAIDVDGYIYIVGQYGSAYEEYMVILKYDSDGNRIWIKRITKRIQGADIAIDKSGYVYIIGGIEVIDDQWYPYFRKFSSEGNLIWEKIFNYKIWLWPGWYSSLTIDQNDNIYVTGRIAPSRTQYDAWVGKYDTSGVEIWWKRFGYGDWNEVWSNDIAVDSSSNIYIIGKTGWTTTEIFFAKFDENGSEKWNKKYGDNDKENEGNGITSDKNGNIYVIGETDGPWVGWEHYVWTAKYNTNGAEIWSKKNFYGTSGTGYDITLDKEGNLYTTGYTNENKPYICKYSSDGNRQWIWKPTEYSSIYAIAVDTYGNVYFVGSKNGIWLGKYGTLTPVKHDYHLMLNDIPETFAFLQNYPNPFNSETIISYNLPKSCNVIIKVYNIYGQLIRTLVNKLQNAGYYSVTWNGNDDTGRHVVSGVYFYHFKTEDYTDTHKMILVR